VPLGLHDMYVPCMVKNSQHKKYRCDVGCSSVVHRKIFFLFY
jgi:hypothetical protein